MKRLKYWYWRKYKWIPHPDELFELWLDNFPQANEDKLKYNYAQIGYEYMCGPANRKNAWIIAEERRITRERVKMCIWKCYRRWSK